MLDVHPPHVAAHTWKEFLIQIATISVGLLIAIGLEQAVEFFHHRHQRHQLEDDLHSEDLNNRDAIRRNLELAAQEKWFQLATSTADSALQDGGILNFTLPLAPCVPGTVGNSEARYISPSEAVWTTAKESNLVVLLPVEEARIYARLAHNYELLSGSRDRMAAACERVYAMQTRFALGSTAATSAMWTTSREQAGQLAEAAAEADAAMQGLMLRLRISLRYEEGILRGDRDADTLIRDANLIKLPQ
jgi:hypothetical protein